MFKGTTMQRLWDELYEEIGAGWILGRFLFLFGEDVERYQHCLDA